MSPDSIAPTYTNSPTGRLGRSCSIGAPGIAASVAISRLDRLWVGSAPLFGCVLNRRGECCLVDWETIRLPSQIEKQAEGGDASLRTLFVAAVEEPVIRIGRSGASGRCNWHRQAQSMVLDDCFDGHFGVIPVKVVAIGDGVPDSLAKFRRYLLADFGDDVDGVR